MPLIIISDTFFVKCTVTTIVENYFNI